MLKGLNSDINYKGLNYHVQTEDWGLDNPYLVSRVFQDGRVLTSLKLAYHEVLPHGIHSDEKDIRFVMNEQHEQIVSLLLSGKLFS